MEDLKIRTMEAQDARAVLQGQKKAFSPVFGLFLSRPKQGIVAESGGRIVGAVTIKSISAGKGRVGYLDIGYVDRTCRGQKLGGRLYEAAMDRLRDEGCESITASIRDDNRASWKIMERNGCAIHPFYRLIGKFGLTGALRIGISAHFPYALGHEIWATGKPSRLPSPASGADIVFCLDWGMAGYRGKLHCPGKGLLTLAFRGGCVRLPQPGSDVSDLPQPGRPPL